MHSFSLSKSDILNKNLLFEDLETQEINSLPVLTNILSKLVEEKTYSLNDERIKSKDLSTAQYVH